MRIEIQWTHEKGFIHPSHFFVSDLYVINVLGKHWYGFNRFDLNHKKNAFFSWSS